MCVFMCVSVERVALRWPFLFSLCFPVLSLPPHVIVFCINPPPFLRASRRLVCSFFSFVTPLFLKSSLIEAEINKEKIIISKDILNDSGVDLKRNGFCLQNDEMISLKLL